MPSIFLLKKLILSVCFSGSEGCQSSDNVQLQMDHETVDQGSDILQNYTELQKLVKFKSMNLNVVFLQLF